MALTRAQYLSGNTSNGPVLPGQPQGVRPGGTGITIAPDGTISVNATTITGVVKLNNETAYNAYLWPNDGPAVPSALIADGAGTISWVPFGGGGGGIGTVTSVNVTGGTTGLTFSGGPVTTAGTMVMDGVLSVEHGGTGTTTSEGAINNLLPAQSGKAGNFLSTNGTDVLWVVPESVSVTQIVAGENITIDPTSGTGVVTINAGGGEAGQGLTLDNKALKVKITTAATPPPPGGTAPGSVVGSLYWDDSLGEMFIYYNDGTTSQWVQTNPGGGGGGASFPAGTVMLFAQAAAPDGWVQVTDPAYDDSALRMVTSAGAGTGGSIAFSTLFSATSTYSGSINITSGSVGSTTLSEAQIGSHAHSYPINGLGLGGGSSNVAAAQQQCTGTGTCGTNAAGGNGAHSHTLAGVAAGGNFTTNFAVKYVNIIACSKQ